jgi:hypothetical protein
MAEETIEEMWKRMEEEHEKQPEMQRLKSYIRELDERIQQSNERVRRMRQKMKQENKYFKEETTNMSERIDVEERVKQMMNCKHEIKDKFQRDYEEIKIRESVLKEVEENINQRVTRIRQEIQNRRKERSNEIEKLSEQLEPTQINIKPEIKDIVQNFGIKESDSSETVVQIHTNFGKLRKRRIRKVRTLKSFGLTTRIHGNKKVREYKRPIKHKREQNKTRKKCNAVIYRKVPLTHPSEVKERSKVFQNVPSKVKTKVKFSKENVFQKVKLKKTSEKHKRQITGVNLTRRLGEQLCTNCHKCNENLNFQSNKFSEKLKSCTNCQMLQSSFQTRTKVTHRNNWDTNLNFESEHLHEKCINSVKLKFQGEIPHERLVKESIVTKHKLRVGNSNNKSRNNQRLQQLFQNGINLTKRSPKVRINLLELEISRLTNRRIPFRIKRKVVRAKKINVKMKTNSRHHNFGKPKWKIKLESQNMQHNLHMK